jgi:hypothetical protein
MKGAGIAAIVLGLLSVGANVYAVAETKPNYEYMEAEIAEHGARTAFDLPLLEEYRDTLKMLAYAAFGLGILALVLGGLGGVKGGFKPSFAGAAMGAIGLIWQFLWAV